MSAEMAVPAGWCAIDPSRDAVERHIWTHNEMLQRGSNKLLAFIAECSALQAAKQGNTSAMTRWIIVLTQLADGKPARMPGVTRERFLSEVAKSVPGMDRIVDEATRDTTARLAEQLKDSNAAVGVDRMLGPLARDPNGLYIGMLGHNRVADKVTPIGALLAFTFIRSHAMSVNAYTHYSAPSDFDVLLNQTKAMTADLAKRND